MSTKTITIRLTGQDDAALEDAFGEATSRIEAGNTSGFDRNEASSFTFDVVTDADDEGADETARKIIATWTRGLITLDEMVSELQKVDPTAPDDVDGERGHCDTCGAPCDDDGCTRDRDHAIAIDPFSTRS